MTTNTAAKPATTLGPSAWVSQVRGLAPGQIPFLLQVAVEAFENGLTPQQFVDALPTLNPDKIRMANWVAKTDLVLGSWANYSQQPPGDTRGVLICRIAPVAIRWQFLNLFSSTVS